MTSDFSTFVPGGWATIDLVPLNERQLSSALGAVVSAAPPQVRGAVRGYASGPLEGTVRALAERGAIRVIMPAEAFAATPIRPMIAVLPLAGGVEGITDPVDYVVMIAQNDPSARMIDPPGMVGIKTRAERSTTRQLQEGLAALPADLAALAGNRLTEASRRGRVTVDIRYVIGVPGQVNKWVDVMATYSHEDGATAREAAEAVELFLDQWVNTLRWSDVA